MSPRLLTAFALSLLLHGGIVLPDAFRRLLLAPVPPPLQATLRLPPLPPTPPDSVIKNTLDEEAPEAKAPPEKPKPATPPPDPRAAEKQVLRKAQRKINEHLFYPPEAIDRGLEGDVRLILVLGAEGRIEDVQLGASSGYAILDNAAIKAAYAMGKVNGVESRQFILPVAFRLR